MEDRRTSKPRRDRGRLVRLGGLGALTLALAACSSLARPCLGLPAYRTGFDHRERVRVPMRDGARLVTDLYFPEGEGPWPVLLVRNPYNMWNIFRPLGEALARYGYVVVHQDVRGRFDSEGVWEPLLHERDDGLDTLAWILRQPWQNGRIALVGASYLTLVQWAIADALPPEVRTLVMLIGSTELHDALWEGGLFRQEVFTFWAALMPGRSLALLNAVAYRKALRHQPAIEVDERFLGRRLPWYRSWLASAPATAAIWQRPEARILRDLPERVDRPVLMMTGFYDIFWPGQLHDYLRLGSRDRSRILVGPWTHLMGIVGDGLKPFPAAGDLRDHMPKLIAWLDHHLRDAPLPAWGPMEIYTIGADRWESFATWPPPTQPLRLHLRGAAAARGCPGGLLLPRPTPYTEVARYRYDPRDPTPTRGGGPLLAYVIPGWSDTRPSNRSQADLCARGDTLTFRSPPLRQPLEIAGPIRVHLVVASDAPDTAFVVKLNEVGRWRTLNVRDRGTTLRYRNGATLPVAYAPGTTVALELELAPIAWRFPVGSRIEVQIASANFPKLNVHPNTRTPWPYARGRRVAHQRVLLGAGHSWIELPVRGDAPTEVALATDSAPTSAAGSDPRLDAD